AGQLHRLRSRELADDVRRGVTDLLLHAARAFTGQEVLDDAWLWVEGDRIVEVADRQPRGAEGATRIDVPTATLLPGLIDCHVHLSIGGGPDWLTELTESYALTCFKSVLRAKETVQAGFTTVRVLAGRPGLDPALRDAQ